MAAAAAFASCDGTVIASASPAGVWQSEDGAWRRLHGEGEAQAPALESAQRASCAEAPILNTGLLPAGVKRIGGSSRDGSLIWVAETGPKAARRFTVRLWTGEQFKLVIDERSP